MTIQTVDSILEDTQEAMVKCGGRFLKREELRSMPYGDVIALLLSNKVEFKVKHKPTSKQEHEVNAMLCYGSLKEKRASFSLWGSGHAS